MIEYYNDKKYKKKFQLAIWKIYFGYKRFFILNWWKAKLS